jgi:hypothetical protein
MVCEYIVHTDSPSALTGFPVKLGDVGETHANVAGVARQEPRPRAPFFAPGNISAGFILKPREETLSMHFGVAWQGEIR